IKDESQVETGYANVMEPILENINKLNKNDIDLLIVPGIIFDKKGYRIGFGGGYYDRYLVDYVGKTVSLAASFQLVENIPKDIFDIAVQCIITEEDILTLQLDDE